MFEARSLKSGDEWGVQDSSFVGRVYFTIKAKDGQMALAQLEQDELKELIEVLQSQVL